MCNVRNVYVVMHVILAKSILLKAATHVVFLKFAIVQIAERAIFSANKN